MHSVLCQDGHPYPVTTWGARVKLVSASASKNVDDLREPVRFQPTLYSWLNVMAGGVGSTVPLGAIHLEYTGKHRTSSSRLTQGPKKVCYLFGASFSDVGLSTMKRRWMSVTEWGSLTPTRGLHDTQCSYAEKPGSINRYAIQFVHLETASYQELRNLSNKTGWNSMHILAEFANTS